MLINLVCWFYLLFLFRIFFSSEAKKSITNVKTLTESSPLKQKKRYISVNVSHFTSGAMERCQMENMFCSLWSAISKKNLKKFVFKSITVLL